jgi:hypothetical protein
MVRVVVEISVDLASDHPIDQTNGHQTQVNSCARGSFFVCDGSRRQGTIQVEVLHDSQQICRLRVSVSHICASPHGVVQVEVTKQDLLIGLIVV